MKWSTSQVNKELLFLNLKSRLDLKYHTLLLQCLSIMICMVQENWSNVMLCAWAQISEGLVWALLICTFWKVLYRIGKFGAFWYQTEPFVTQSSAIFWPQSGHCLPGQILHTIPSVSYWWIFQQQCVCTISRWDVIWKYCHLCLTSGMILYVRSCDHGLLSVTTHLYRMWWLGPVEKRD